MFSGNKPMARCMPQSQFDIAHLLLDHASIKHESKNRFCSEDDEVEDEDDTSIRVENRGTGFTAKQSVGMSG